ncbi:MAG: ABC transporter ATP-binding protein [Planctomycetota bacterium]
MSTAITIEALAKTYPPAAGRPATHAVDRVSLTVEPGELFFLLGPSGCGKTTLLRMVAGFIDPTGGRIRFDDRDVTHTPANQRDTGMVFQSYALWPHMTVRQNVAFGLEIRKLPRAERNDRVDEALAAVRITELADRKPTQLSGGQQQRVALARALVIRPTVLLLDEPLSNLDAKLRADMRTEIRRICKDAGTTALYVTHDQKEALAIADRIAVMRDGRLAQVGTPEQIYRRPTSRFVANFLGETNFIDATVHHTSNGQAHLDCPGGQLHATLIDENDISISINSRAVCCIRPEALRMSESVDGGTGLAGTVTHSVYLGEITMHTIELARGMMIHAAEHHPKPGSRAGQRVHLRVEPDDVTIIEAHAGEPVVAGVAP